MLDPSWRCISGFHVEEDGTAACSWVAQDPITSVVYVFDAAKFHAESPVVIADGITSRGRWIPMAWRRKDEEFVKKLLECGVNALTDPVADSQPLAEVNSSLIFQWMQAGRFAVNASVFQWRAEADKFKKQDQRVPVERFPVMSATRYAVEMLPFARAREPVWKNKRNYPQVSVF